MHQHSRVPAPTASPASSPSANPQRTNSSRDLERGGLRSGSEVSTPSEQGIGIAEAGGDAPVRAQYVSSQGRDNLAKLSQVIQVRPYIKPSWCLIFTCKAKQSTELFFQVRFNHITISSLLAACIQQVFRRQKGQQMGKAYFRLVVQILDLG